MLVVECQLVCLVEWAAWVVWVEWECNPPHSLKNLKTPEKSTSLAFFFVLNLQCSNNVNSM
jgi:hypothetical protein